MSGVDTPRDSAGRFLAKESKSDSGGIDGSSPAVLAKFENGLTTDEYREALEAAAVLKAAQDKREAEAAVLRVQWADDHIVTIVTTALMMKFLSLIHI